MAFLLCRKGYTSCRRFLSKTEHASFHFLYICQVLGFDMLWSCFLRRCLAVMLWNCRRVVLWVTCGCSVQGFLYVEKSASPIRTFPAQTTATSHGRPWMAQPSRAKHFLTNCSPGWAIRTVTHTNTHTHNYKKQDKQAKPRADDNMGDNCPNGNGDKNKNSMGNSISIHYDNRNMETHPLHNIYICNIHTRFWQIQTIGASSKIPQIPHRTDVKHPLNYRNTHTHRHKKSHPLNKFPPLGQLLLNPSGLPKTWRNTPLTKHDSNKSERFWKIDTLTW